MFDSHTIILCDCSKLHSMLIVLLNAAASELSFMHDNSYTAHTFHYYNVTVATSIM